MAVMPDPMKATKQHVLDRASEILEDARRLGYFRFKCRLQGDVLLLMFTKGGSVHYERQVGWTRFYGESDGTANVPASLCGGAAWWRPVVLKRSEYGWPNHPARHAKGALQGQS
jgi:hypothetical protein